MNGKLFCINKNGYPEDWVLIYAEDEAHAILQYSKDFELSQISVDEFFERYEIGFINTIGNRKIKEIVFED